MPIWVIGALVFVIQMAPTPATFHKRLAVGALIGTGLWAILFCVIPTSVAFATRPGDDLVNSLIVMGLFFVLFMVAFVVAADLAFRAAFGPLTFDLSNMRDLRGVHLGLNLAGMFVFPIFTYIGIPLTLAKVARHRNNHKSLFGWSVACGTLTLLVVTVVILLASITASLAPNVIDEDHWGSRCRKRFVLQDTDNMTMTDLNSTSTNFSATADGSVTTTTFWDPMSKTAFWDPTTTTLVDVFTTGLVCWADMPSSSAWTVMGARVGPGWLLGRSWSPSSYSHYYSSMIQQADVIISVTVLSLVAWVFHAFFIAFADKIILKNMPGGQQTVSGVVVSQAPSASAQQLVHPCASCGTPLQFVRTGPTTQVQCFQCRAIVEFTTA